MLKRTFPQTGSQKRLVPVSGRIPGIVHKDPILLRISQLASFRCAVTTIGLEAVRRDRPIEDPLNGPDGSAASRLQHFSAAGSPARVYNPSAA